MGQVTVEREEFWGFALSEHAQSGLSILDFRRHEGVSQSSFYKWRKRLAVSTTPTTAKADADGPAGITSFVPVEVVAQNDRNSVGLQCGFQSNKTAESNSTAESNKTVESNSTAALTIRTPQGFAIEVSSNTSIDVLQCSLRVLQQLASEPSS